MMRVLVVAVLMAAGFARGQDKPATVDADRLREAQAKLEAKDKARQAEREKMVTISAGELADLRARVAELEAEVRQAKASATTKAAPRKIRTEIEVGMTKEELQRFIQQKGLRIVSTSTDAVGGGKQENMRLARLVKDQRPTNKRNTLGQQVYESYEREEGRILVTVVDGVVTSVSAK